MADIGPIWYFFDDRGHFRGIYDIWHFFPIFTVIEHFYFYFIIPKFHPGQDMLKNISNKLKTTSTRPYKSPKSLQHSRMQSFDAYFQDLMHRKDHQCHLIQTPQLNQRIEEIHTHFDNVWASALSSPTTPSTKTHKRLQRKKYQALKQKIYTSVQEFHQLDLTNLKLLFSLKQKILNDFLNQFTQQITKQCRQKGDILIYIWNSMFSMIQHISQQLSQHLRQKELLELKHSIAQHQSYQGMLENIKQKYDQLKEQSEVDRTAIAKLIYELRYKRKEINRLYKTQKTLQNKLNQLKNDNVHIKTNYIDIVSSLKELPPESVQQMLKARSQLNRDKQVKFKVKNSKKNNRIQIAKELGTSSKQAMSQLLFQIKEIAKAESNSPKVISTLLDAAIQNFGISHDDCKNTHSQLIQIPQTTCTSDVEIQVNLTPTKLNSKIQQSAQTSYSDKINFNLVQNKVTQTFNQLNQKKILFDTRGTTTQDISKKYVDWYFSISQVCAQKIQGKAKEDTVVSPPVKFDRHTKKKHMSDMNMQIDWRTSSQKNTIFQQKQEEIESCFKKKQSTDSQISDTIDRQFQKINDKGLLNSKKDGPLQKPQKKSRKSAMPLSRKSIDLSRRVSKNVSPQTKQTESEVNRDSSVNRSNMDSQQVTPSVQQVTPSVQQVTPSVLIKKRRKGINIPINQYQKMRQEFSNIKFLDKNRKSFNINIDSNKQTEIYNIFVKNRKNNFYLDPNQMSQQDDSQKQLQNDMLSRTLQKIQLISQRQKVRKQTTSSLAKNTIKSQEDQVGDDQQNMLLNVCRDKYYQKNRKKRQRGSIIKYRDQFTSVKDKIQVIAQDVGAMMVDKQDYLRKTVNSKNIKTLYKILMMTFAKAYDCYSKGIVISNLVFPLFESFSLIYGNINTSQVYKRMINFIAFLSVKSDNGIFKFFLFFLGLDRKSPYSQHVSICEVYLCLALLQKISVLSKVTLNIDSIYTDTNRIKEQLIGVLRQYKIPECLCILIKRKVDQQLQNSSAIKNSDDNDAQLKVNIYNIILLIVQEVIKCKLKMKQSFRPLLQCCPQFKLNNRIPIALLQSLLSMCVTAAEQREIVAKLTGMLRRKYEQGTIQVEQFYSMLFQKNLISLTQVMEQNYLPLYRIKIPLQFNSHVTDSIKRTRISSNTQLEHFEYELYAKLVALKTFKNGQEKTTAQIMKKLIFIKIYHQKADSLWKQVVGPDLASLMGEL